MGPRRRATPGGIAARLATACLALLCCAVLLPAAAAQAGQVLAPPGDAGANEYFETVPTVSGNRAPPAPTPIPATSTTSGSATAAPGRAGAAGGSTSTSTSGQARARGSANQSTVARGERALANLGRDGQKAAALAAAGAPPGASLSAGAKARGGKTTSAASSPTVTLPAGESAADAVAHVVGGSAHGGLGVWLPVLLAAAVGAAMATLLARRRRPRDAG